MQRRHPLRGVNATLFAAASTLAIAAFTGAFTAQAETGAKPVTWEDILNDEKTTGDVVSWGMGVRNHRYSTLEQINVNNIGQMKPTWSFSFGDEKQRGHPPVRLPGKGGGLQPAPALAPPPQNARPRKQRHHRLRGRPPAPDSVRQPVVRVPRLQLIRQHLPNKWVKMHQEIQ